MMPLYLKKQTGSIQDLRALIGETQNQPTEKHATAISNRKTIYLSVRVTYGDKLVKIEKREGRLVLKPESTVVLEMNSDFFMSYKPNLFSSY